MSPYRHLDASSTTPPAARIGFFHDAAPWLAGQLPARAVIVDAAPGSAVAACALAATLPDAYVMVVRRDRAALRHARDLTVARGVAERVDLQLLAGGAAWQIGEPADLVWGGMLDDATLGASGPGLTSLTVGLRATGLLAWTTPDHGPSRSSWPPHPLETVGTRTFLVGTEAAAGDGPPAVPPTVETARMHVARRRSHG